MIAPRKVALQDITSTLDPLAIVTEGFLYRFDVVVIPPLEYLPSSGGAEPNVVRPYFDDDMEMREVLSVIRAFLRVTHKSG